jgi:short subunit dehydrogenase-like uncharacterized protein
MLMFLFWILVIVLRIPLIRYVVTKTISLRGEGPNEERRKINRASVVVVATDTDNHSRSSQHKRVVKVTVSDGDAYDQTAYIVSLCALLLIEEADKFKNRGGVMTPVTAFGDSLIHKMNNVGIVINKEHL